MGFIINECCHCQSTCEIILLMVARRTFKECTKASITDIVFYMWCMEVWLCCVLLLVKFISCMESSMWLRLRLSLVAHSDPRAHMCPACIQKLGCPRTGWQRHPLFFSACFRCVKLVSSWLFKIMDNFVLEMRTAHNPKKVD